MKGPSAACAPPACAAKSIASRTSTRPPARVLGRPALAPDRALPLTMWSMKPENLCLVGAARMGDLQGAEQVKGGPCLVPEGDAILVPKASGTRKTRVSLLDFPRIRIGETEFGVRPRHSSSGIPMQSFAQLEVNPPLPEPPADVRAVSAATERGPPGAGRGGQGAAPHGIEAARRARGIGFTSLPRRDRLGQEPEDGAGRREGAPAAPGVRVAAARRPGPPNRPRRPRARPRSE